MNNFDEWWEQCKKEIHEEETIRCPYCQIVYAEPGDEASYDFITYYGYFDSGEQEAECDNCGQKFVVREIVTREFECLKKEESGD